MFTLTFQNGSLVLGAPSFQNRLKKCQKGTECLSQVFLHVCEEEGWHLLQNFIDEIRKSRH